MQAMKPSGSPCIFLASFVLVTDQSGITAIGLHKAENPVSANPRKDATPSVDLTMYGETSVLFVVVAGDPPDK